MPDTRGGTPIIEEFRGAPKAGDGARQLGYSIQVETGDEVELSWTIKDAPDGVELNDPSSGPKRFAKDVSTTTVTAHAEVQDYELVALSGGRRSTPWKVHVSTHSEGELFSPHMEISAPFPAVDFHDATPSARGDFGAAVFETDKTFPLPSALPIFGAVAAYANKEPQRLYLVVGHTDAVGTAKANLELSGERAKSIAAYLKDDVDAWMQFYESSGHSSKQWGEREDKHMLHATGFYEHEHDGPPDEEFEAAVRAFQRTQKLHEDGVMGAQTRRALVEVYMSADGTSVPASVEIQTLACGQRHLIEKTNGASETNRRVDVFAFEQKPVKPAPDECASGEHPGCDVYDQWKAEVTGPI